MISRSPEEFLKFEEMDAAWRAKNGTARPRLMTMAEVPSWATEVEDRDGEDDEEVRAGWGLGKGVIRARFRLKFVV